MRNYTIQYAQALMMRSEVYGAHVLTYKNIPGLLVHFRIARRCPCPDEAALRILPTYPRNILSIKDPVVTTHITRPRRNIPWVRTVYDPTRTKRFWTHVASDLIPSKTSADVVPSDDVSFFTWHCSRRAWA